MLTKLMRNFNYLIKFFFNNLEEMSHLVLSVLDMYYFDKLYICRSFEDMYLGLIVTIYFGLLFLTFQFCEYEYYATFDVDNIYGTVFYSLTLLHGFHVYVGIFSLTLCFSYFNSFQFNKADMNKGMFNHF
jgi:heme/copper-type cytochrome/quinol oxidase subunit 3